MPDVKFSLKFIWFIILYQNFSIHNTIFNPLVKEVIFSVALKLVWLFVCLYCEQHYSKSYERIVMKVYGGVQGGTMRKV